MTSKTISLKEETYRRLARVKGEEESFSDVIDRLLEAENQPLARLVGLLADDQVTALRERSGQFRASIDGRLRVEDER